VSKGQAPHAPCTTTPPLPTIPKPKKGAHARTLIAHLCEEARGVVDPAHGQIGGDHPRVRVRVRLHLVGPHERAHFHHLAPFRQLYSRVFFCVYGLVGWLVGGLCAPSPPSRHFGSWVVGWVVYWLVCWLVDWLAGWLVCSFVVARGGARWGG
jgi:hypothetical protein